MKTNLGFILIVIFLACREPSKINTPGKENLPFHKVIYLDEYYAEFLKSARRDSVNSKNLYTELRNKIIKDHFSRSEYSDLVFKSLSPPLKDTDALTKYIDALHIHKKEIEKTIASAYTRCNDYLKNDSVTFYISPSSADFDEIMKKMGGVTGQTAGSKQIMLTIDFNIPSWKDFLEYDIAHEYNHSYWTKMNYTNSYKWTLLQYMLLEGKADSFAHLLYPGIKAPWTLALNENEKSKLWKRIKPHLQSNDPQLLRDVMFGSGDYPVWGGYTLGFDILQGAFKNNPRLVKTIWTNTEADSLLALSSYK